VLWDLALVSVFINEEMGTLTRVMTSRDSGNREIGFYEHIDVKAIYADFHQGLAKFSKRK